MKSSGVSLSQRTSSAPTYKWNLPSATVILRTLVDGVGVKNNMNTASLLAPTR